MQLNAPRKSQTLLEAILAIGVVLVTTVSASTLVVSTVTAGQSSEDKIIASNLAREGVEVIRGLRDSNWLKRDQNVCDGTAVNCNAATAFTFVWDDDGTNVGYTSLGTAVGKCYQIDFNFGTQTWSVSPSSPAVPRCTTASTSAEVRKMTKAPPGSPPFLTDHHCVAGDTAPPKSCVATKYKRVLTIQKLTETPSGFSSPIDYLKVTATITWNYHGSKTYSTTERLYNWR